MKEAFKQVPEPLQKQILSRCGWGIVALFVSVVLFFTVTEFFSVLSCLMIHLFFAVSALLLFRKAIVGDYVVVEGEIISVTYTAIGRRANKIDILTDKGDSLQIRINQRLKKVRPGNRVVLYVGTNAPVYETGNIHLLHSYLAIETKGGECAG